MSDETVDQAGSAIVTYDVRDLLADIKTAQTAGFARLEFAVAAKADKADVARMEARLDHQAREIAGVQKWQHDKDVTEAVHGEHEKRSFTFRQKLGAMIATVCLLLATMLGPYLGAHAL